MKNQVRYLTSYVKMKLDMKLDQVEEQELADFFNKKGWYLYDIDKLAKDFEDWRKGAKVIS